MDWTPDGKQLPHGFLGDLQPEDVLVDYEGPRSFTARDRQGELLFAHQCGESEEVWRYAVVPFTETLLEELTHGRLDLWSALSQTRLWVVDIRQDGTVAACVSSSLRQVPETCRPQPGVMIYREHEPVLSLRALGTHVELGRANLGLLREQLDSVRNGLRHLAEGALGVFQTKGPPSKQTRGYYDLPALMLAGSVQVSVYRPADPQGKLFETDGTWERMADLLQWGFRQIAEGDQGGEPSFGNLQTQEAAIKAVYALAPPARGNVSETEISGQIVRTPSLCRRLNRNARVKLNHRLRQVHEVPAELEVAENEGYVTELDLEEGTCLLRDAEGNTIQRLQFAHEVTITEESLFEDVREAFDTGSRVVIRGIRFAPGGDVALVSVNVVSEEQPTTEDAPTEPWPT